MNYNNLIDLTALKYWFEQYVIPSVQTMINTSLNEYKIDAVTVLSSLPNEGEEGIFYMIPNSEEPTKFDTFVWEKDDNDVYSFVQQGHANIEVDLSDYYTKSEIDTEFSDYYTKSEVDTELSDKQNSLSQEQLDAVNSGITSTVLNSILDRLTALETPSEDPSEPTDPSEQTENP